MKDETLAELGENESLRRTVSRLKPGNHTIIGSGDDAAVIKSDGSFVVSTDTMVQDHDFKLEYSTGFNIGFKAVATNLADIAAMGAKPTALVVAVVVPKETKISWLENFADGLQAGIDSLAPESEVVGGDIAAGDQVVISVTVHGSLEGRDPVLRSGAKPGDLIAVAGPLGKAACGLALLFSEQENLVRSYDEWVLQQLQPAPPISQGVVAAVAGATSMLDVSDGLLTDLARVARASSCSMNINSKDLFGFEAMLELPAQALDVSPRQWVLNGGEDHSLLATFPNVAAVPISFKVIGEVIASKDGSLFEVLLDHAPVSFDGWDSIRG